jgi:hypothetical protein
VRGDHDVTMVPRVWRGYRLSFVRVMGLGEG